MENLLISACLLGVLCRYDGKSKPLPEAEKLMEKYNLIPVCAEIMGGLSTPRDPAEIIGEKVITKNGKDVTEEYIRGAKEVLRLGKMFGCKKALLKERSPSCGTGTIHNGKFDGGMVPGFGKTAELLLENKIEVFGESKIDELMK
ncbi:MAG: DUF523 domain-containing protein [Oscillospiraceae bacterium]|nr:DUF523 domain-containing protein [Oscillospiraceae bacterium]